VLDHLDFLTAEAKSVATVADGLVALGEAFEETYSPMVRAVLVRQLPTALCSIADRRFPDPAWQRLAVMAVTVFNNVIMRAALKAVVPLLDLYLVCTEEVDYPNLSSRRWPEAPKLPMPYPRSCRSMIWGVVVGRCSSGQRRDTLECFHRPRVGVPYHLCDVSESMLRLGADLLFHGRETMAGRREAAKRAW
jgi:hypothetical protein